MSMKDKAKGKEIAEQRMSMIAPLLSVSPVESAARKKEEISNQFQVSVRTLERYLAAYEKDGFEALIPKGRMAEVSEFRNTSLTKQSCSAGSSPVAAFPPSSVFWNWRER